MMSTETTTDTDFFLHTHEVASRCRLSVRTIQRLTARGDFPPAVRIGARRIAYRTSAIDQWMADRPLVAVRARSID